MDKMRLFMKKLTLLLITTAFFLTNCGIYKRSDVKDNPVNIDERVQKNIEEGRGIRFGKEANQVPLLILHPLTNFGEPR